MMIMRALLVTHAHFDQWSPTFLIKLFEPINVHNIFVCLELRLWCICFYNVYVAFTFTPPIPQKTHNYLLFHYLG